MAPPEPGRSAAKRREIIAGRSQLRLATFSLPTHREVVAAASRISALGAPHTLEVPGSRAFHAACLHSTPPRYRISNVPTEGYTRAESAPSAVVHKGAAC